VEPRSQVDPERATTSARIALGASAGSFLLVALVAAAPGSPFTPVLPAEPGGPLRALAELVGLDRLEGSALVAVGVAAVAFAVAAFLGVLREAWRGRVSPRAVGWLAGAFLAAVLSLPLLFSRDVYSYAAYGRIAAVYHLNPYVATPADVPGDVLAPFVGPKWFDTPAVYGPLWTQVSSLVVRVGDDVDTWVAAFRALAVAATAATLVVVSRAVRRVRPQREAFALALIGLNPVVVFQSVASGHNDVLVMLSVAAALALVLGGRERWATAALALGALVKASGVVPLVLLWVWVAARRPRGERWRALVPHVAIAGALGLVAAAPFLNRTDPTLGMAELATHEGWLAPSRLLRRLASAVGGDALAVVPRLAFAALAVGALVALARGVARRAPGGGPSLVGASWGWGLALLMLLGPVLLPWYVTWALPVAWLLPRAPRTVLVGTGVALALSQWTSEPAAFEAAYDANVLVGHYALTPAIVALLAWLLLDLARRLRSGAPLEDRAAEVPAPAGER
jgi:hypothetical protein